MSNIERVAVARRNWREAQGFFVSARQLARSEREIETAHRLVIRALNTLTLAERVAR